MESKVIVLHVLRSKLKPQLVSLFSIMMYVLGETTKRI